MILRSLLIALALVTSSFARDTWKFHCEAEKGDLTVSIPKQPLPLESYLSRLPIYTPDPPEKNAVIQSSTVRQLGMVSGHRILEAQIRIEKDYYTDFYVLLIETDSGRYLPIYAQQYNRGTRQPELTSFSVDDPRCSMQVIMRYSGTGAFYNTDDITVTVTPRNKIKLECNRKT